MNTISQLAKHVRDDNAAKILGDIQDSPKSILQVDEAGVPLCHLFALKKQLSLIENEIDATALEIIWDLQGWTLAHTAAAVGNAEPLKKAISRNSHVLCWSDWQGRTPVHLAAQHAHLDQLDVDASHLTARDNLQCTPLHTAALNSCLHQVADKLTPEMLLMVNLKGETVLELAKELSTTNKTASATLKNVAWEAEFLTDPKKRTVENVLQHHGIKLK